MKKLLLPGSDSEAAQLPASVVPAHSSLNFLTAETNKWKALYTRERERLIHFSIYILIYFLNTDI